MRIIAGQFRSRPLQAPTGMGTRPSSDRLRETLFNVLAPQIEDASFLDLYAGSGAVGIEALSRGAARVVFVERAPSALKILRGNLARLGVAGRFRIHPGAVAAYLRRIREGHTSGFNLVFLDPPYDAEEEYAATLNLLAGPACGALAADALVIAEHRRKQQLDPEYGRLHRIRLLEQGDTALSFYQLAAVQD